ncbi:hypothetical protein [Proteiniclasticum ruminis]|uniref:hypothetical protein n=1 Tax=Proteiniclasticum ruminis TaxID=398199 RepID=UPI0028A6848F|nr:hypothetical protein [Proteiniclasticum ruminis]
MWWIIGIIFFVGVIWLIVQGIRNGVKKFNTSSSARVKYFLFMLILFYAHGMNFGFSWIVALFLFSPFLLRFYKNLKNNLGNGLIKNQIKEWESQHAPRFSYSEIYKMFDGVPESIAKTDANTQIYFGETIPYGRANNFLNYFEKSIELEEVLYYSPKRSLEDEELREYGMIVTLGGIYLSNQYLLDSKKREYGVDLFDIRFKGLFVTNLHEDILTLIYNDLSGVRLRRGECSIPLEVIDELCKFLINNRFTLSLLKENISDDTISDGINYKNALKEIEETFSKNQNESYSNDILTNAGTVGAMHSMAGQYGELKNLMNGRQGHGYGAEYGNNTMDKLRGKSVQNAGQKLVNGRQVKNGADRIVNGVEIQTKYCRSASSTLGEIIDHDRLRYWNSEGKPMRIEVPREQYKKVVNDLQRKIDNGEIKDLPKGTKATKIIAKGLLTYLESQRVAKGGTIEGLVVDTANGVITCAYAGGISALMNFATNIWAGASLEDSIASSVKVSAKVMGRGTAIYVLSMQLSRKEFVNYFKGHTLDGILNGTGYSTILNPAYIASEKLARDIKGSTLARSTLGNKLQLQKIDGKMVISSGVMFAFTFGPDIARTMVGRISTKQLFKNATTSSAAIAGAAIGNTFMPVVGAVVGGAVGGFIAKSVLDEFIEDDAKEMFQVLKEEFIDCVMLMNLKKEEFAEMLSMTMGNPELPHVLRDMYASQNVRNYARENLVEEAAVIILGKRKRITADMMDEAMNKYIEAEYTLTKELA